MEVDDFILVACEKESLAMADQIRSHDYLSEIDDAIESLQNPLASLNTYIHENPELAFEEHKAHDALTKFMRSQKGWRVTTSAYGIKTAWVAVYDSGKSGPVVSFNAEMGMATPNGPTWGTRCVENSRHGPGIRDITCQGSFG
jgi:hypothetical protein